AGVAGGRAARYHEQAAHFQNLAQMESEPQAREQLLRLAGEYRELADRGPRRPSAELLGARAENSKIGARLSRWVTGSFERAEKPPA
ncbi:MAG: hypothetical protein JO058_03350, partial [Alphaproteobacteria bacterium]|nr:hypothetical protein [Alphaproteobacteria bacterium]